MSDAWNARIGPPPAAPEPEAETPPPPPPKRGLVEVPRPKVPLPLLLRLLSGALLAYGLAVSLSGLSVSWLQLQGLAREATATTVGLGLGLAIGASWVFATLLSANASLRVKFGATVMFMPLRVLGSLMVLFTFATWLQDSAAVAVMVFTLIGAEVFNFTVYGVVMRRLDLARSEQKSASQGEG